MCEVPTEEILQDIKDTEDELKDLRTMTKILEKHPVENKTKIFFNGGNIKRMEDFIEKLNDILKERNINN